MKYSKNYVLSLLFCFCNIVIITSFGSENCKDFILKSNPNDNQFDPYFTGTRNGFLVATVEEKLKNLPIVNKLSNDHRVLCRYGSLVYKTINIYAQKNKYFPLNECISPWCFLTRMNPGESIREIFTKLLTNTIVSFPLTSDEPLRIISNATGCLFMEYTIMREYYNIFTSSIHKHGKEKKIEFYCIDPFFQFIGTGENKPFNEQNKASTSKSRLYILSILKATNYSNAEKCKEIIEKYLLMGVIDKFVKLCKDDFDINVDVFTYISIQHFIDCNKNNDNIFPLCYTIDLCSTLPNFREYQLNEYKTLRNFIKSRINKNKSNIKEGVMYFLDSFDCRSKPAILCEQIN